MHYLKFNKTQQFFIINVIELKVRETIKRNLYLRIKKTNSKGFDKCTP